MTAHELDQPRMIYTGELPPHLTMRPADPYDEIEEEDEDFGPPAEASRSILPIVLATAAALAAGIAIGVFAPMLLRGPSARPEPPRPALLQATLTPEPIAPAEPAAAPPSPERTLAEGPPPPPIKAHAPAAPLRLAVARIAPSRAAAGPWRASRSNDKACAPYACPDPAIAEAETDLQQAYQRALRAGAPADELRAGQIDWLLARQTAAHRSPGDLPGLYRQRIAQLNALADEEPPH